MWIKFSKDGKCYRARIINIIKKEGIFFNLLFVEKRDEHYLEIEELDFENDRYYPLTKQCIQYTWFLRHIEEADNAVFISELEEKAKEAIKEYEEDKIRKETIQMNRATRITVIK